MAKRRQIHPETWTDTKFVSLSPLARLLFIGMWNFACDNGHLDDDTLQLKMRVLPADNCDADELVSEVVASGMAIRRDGYLKVVNLPSKQALDLRFLVFCDHCEVDPERHYHDEDKPSNRRSPKGGTTSARRAHDETPTSARRSGDGDGDGDGDRARAKRGTRIPDDFAVTDDMRGWATEKGWGSLDLDGITEEFFDYWHGLAGTKATKVDWVGTWRNWIRRKAEDAKVRSITTGPKPVHLLTIDEKAARGIPEGW